MLLRLLLLSICAAGVVQPFGAEPAQTPAPFELDEMTVAQLQDAMASGRYTSRRLVDLYLERIQTIDRSGPTSVPSSR